MKLKKQIEKEFDNIPNTSIMSFDGVDALKRNVLDVIEKYKAKKKRKWAAKFGNDFADADLDMCMRITKDEPKYFSGFFGRTEKEYNHKKLEEISNRHPFPFSLTKKMYDRLGDYDKVELLFKYARKSGYMPDYILDTCIGGFAKYIAEEKKYGTSVTLNELKGHYKTNFMSADDFIGLVELYTKIKIENDIFKKIKCKHNDVKTTLTEPIVSSTHLSFEISSSCNDCNKEVVPVYNSRVGKTYRTKQ